MYFFGFIGVSAEIVVKPVLFDGFENPVSKTLYFLRFITVSAEIVVKHVLFVAFPKNIVFHAFY